jgi:hypothetical protein
MCILLHQINNQNNVVQQKCWLASFVVYFLLAAVRYHSRTVVAANQFLQTTLACCSLAYKAGNRHNNVWCIIVLDKCSKANICMLCTHQSQLAFIHIYYIHRPRWQRTCSKWHLSGCFMVDIFKVIANQRSVVHKICHVVWSKEA